MLLDPERLNTDRPVIEAEGEMALVAYRIAALVTLIALIALIALMGEGVGLNSCLRSEQRDRGKNE